MVAKQELNNLDGVRNQSKIPVPDYTGKEGLVLTSRCWKGRSNEKAKELLFAAQLCGHG